MGILRLLGLIRIREHERIVRALTSKAYNDGTLAGLRIIERDGRDIALRQAELILEDKEGEIDHE